MPDAALRVASCSEAGRGEAMCCRAWRLVRWLGCWRRLITGAIDVNPSKRFAHQGGALAAPWLLFLARAVSRSSKPNSRPLRPAERRC